MFLSSLRLSEHLRRPLCCRAMVDVIKSSHVAGRALEGLLTATGRLVMPHMDRGSPNTLVRSSAMLTWRLFAGPATYPARGFLLQCGAAECWILRARTACRLRCILLFYTHTTSVARPAFRAAGVPQIFLCMISKTTLGGRGLTTPC